MATACDSRLVDVEGKPAWSTVKINVISWVHIDIAEVCTGDGKFQLFINVKTRPGG